jgi:hypothetical protein
LQHTAHWPKGEYSPFSFWKSSFIWPAHVRQFSTFLPATLLLAYVPGSPVIFTASWWTAGLHSNKIINKASKNTQGIVKIAGVAVYMVW